MTDMEQMVSKRKEFGYPIGGRIKQARVSVGMTQTQFAEALGYEGKSGQALVARWESGKLYEFDFYTIVQISKITGKSLYYFLGADY